MILKLVFVLLIFRACNKIFQNRNKLRPFAYFLISMLLFVGVSHGEHMLIIGDSQGCGSFGKNLVDTLSRQGHEVTLYCMPSSTPSNWLRQTLPVGQKCKVRTTKEPVFKLCGGNGAPPSLDELLKDQRVTRVIVELGGNSLTSDKPDSFYLRLAEKIYKNEKSCDWYGPAWRQPENSKPNRDKLEKANHNIPLFVNSLERQIGKYCSVIDSKDATGPGQPGNETVDGIHRTETAGKIWAQSVGLRYKSPPKVKTNPTGVR